jgi:hypothetical protein
VYPPHHLGWLVAQVIVSDIGVLYEAAAPVPSPSSRRCRNCRQYADFAAWQRNAYRGALEEDCGTGRVRSPAPGPRAAPTGPAGEPSFAGNHVSIEVASDVMAKLRALSREHRGTMFMVIIAAFNIVLSRYSGQRDIVIGTASAGRDLPELKGVIGFFTNMVVLRTDLSGDPTFLEILQRVREVALTAYTHQQVPFEKLVERVGQRRDPTRSRWPCSATIEAEGGARDRAEDVDGDDRTAVRASRPASTLARLGTRWGLVDATDLFDRPRIVRMTGTSSSARGRGRRPDRPASQVPMLTDAERQQVLHECRPGTGVPLALFTS